MTTASTALPLPFRENRFLQALCVVMGVVLLLTGLDPVKSFDWWLENLLAFVFLGILAATYHRLTLSQTSYLLILIFLCLHEWGAQYKYSHVPLGEWMKTWLYDGQSQEAARNHYDRVMHFEYGLLLAYPMQEWFQRSAQARGGWSYFFAIQMTLACSAVYEIMEAFMAAILSPERGEEFVGMQGDMWDAQKDMFVAGVGAVLAMAVVAGIRQRRAKAVRNAPAAVYTKSTYAGMR